jgi:hypothetical protein
MPGRWQVSNDMHGVLREGVQRSSSTKLGGSAGLQRLLEPARSIPAAHVRHHAEELLRSVNRSVPLRANIPPHPSKWAQL